MGAATSTLVSASLNRRPMPLLGLAFGALGMLAGAALTWRASRSSCSSSGSRRSDEVEGVKIFVQLSTEPEPVATENDNRDKFGTEDREWALELVKAAGVGSTHEVMQMLAAPPAESAHDLAALVNIDAAGPASNWVNLTAHGAAALNGHVEVLARLLDARADPDSRCQNASSWDGAFTLTRRETAMCMAIKAGHVDCVRTLLDAGADVNARSESEYFEGAVEWGEDDDGTDTMWYSVLDVALSEHQPEIEALVRARGGSRIAQPETRPRRKMVSSGNRMGA